MRLFPCTCFVSANELFAIISPISFIFFSYFIFIFVFEIIWSMFMRQQSNSTISCPTTSICVTVTLFPHPTWLVFHTSSPSVSLACIFHTRAAADMSRWEEQTSELQSRQYL